MAYRELTVHICRGYSIPNLPAIGRRGLGYGLFGLSKIRPDYQDIQYCAVGRERSHYSGSSKARRATPVRRVAPRSTPVPALLPIQVQRAAHQQVVTAAGSLDQRPVIQL